MMKPTKDQQLRHVVEGMALAVLARGVDAVSSNKIGLELAFNHAWRQWPCAKKFPSIGGHDPGNLFWIGVGKSERRRSSRARWQVERWATPYVALDMWTVDECLDLHDEFGVDPESWKRLGELFVAHFKPDHVRRADLD